MTSARRIEDAKSASGACYGLDGVEGGSYSVSTDGGDATNTVELRVQGVDERNAVVDCLEAAGAEVSIERADADATRSSFENTGP